MKKLYRFDMDYGRHGSLTGLFIEEESKVKAAMSKEIYMTDCLGKHSEIWFELKEGDNIVAISENQELIRLLEEEVGAWISGHNPIHYLRNEN